MRFINDAGRAHTEPHFDSNTDTHGQSGSSTGTRPNTDSFADATIANADTVAHTITNAVAFTNACSDSRDHLHHVGLRARPVDERHDRERTA